MDFIPLFSANDPRLNYVVTHVFFPPALPEESDHTIQNEFSLARAACTAAHAYSAHVDDTFRLQWDPIVKMLDQLQAFVQSGQLDRDDVMSQLGDILALPVRSQHAGVIFRKLDDCTLCESFEASPRRDAVMRTGKRLVCSYGGKVIQIQNSMFDDVHFQTELAKFLSLPYKTDSDPPDVPPGHPGYITALLTGILHSVGRIVEAPHVVKRVGDEIGNLEKKEDSWRRSPIWLLIRVAIQTSLDRSSVGRAFYKAFVLFFLCNLAKDANDAGYHGNFLHLISCKILRRLSKHGSSTPDWLSDMAINACNRLQDTLDAKAAELQAPKTPPYWNPSELDLAGDTQLSLRNSGEYIRSVIENTSRMSPATPFRPKEYYRGTLEDFLSSNTTYFDKAYKADPFVTLYDVEQSVEQDLDYWVAYVTNVDVACMQLVTLMDVYMSNASVSYTDNPEFQSIMTLTALELWVALDKLVVGEIPMLAEYSPEIHISLLESLLLRETTSFHRLSRVYQYLSARRSGSRAGFSVLSEEFTENSFSIRYFDSSLDLQILKCRIETEAKTRSSEDEATCLGLTFRNNQSGPYDFPRQADEKVDGVEELVPILPLQMKVIAFELQCPILFRAWRDAVVHLLYRFDKVRVEPFETQSWTARPHDLLFDIPEMQAYLPATPRQDSPTHNQFLLAYFHHRGGFDSGIRPRLGYALQSLRPRNGRARWCELGDGPLSQNITYYNFFNEDPFNDETRGLASYVGNTTHTPNSVVSAQATCPSRFSADGILAFGHLRSGGSLQWINILRELRGRTLNFRSEEVFFILAEATSQVGPCDISTGDWLWHQQLQDSSFCESLLNELEILFVDVSTALLDEVTMRTISMLVTRVLASSPSKGVLERALQLLRHVRKKTFMWVQELAYNLMQEPTNYERRWGLHKMAATCRRTFDVSTTLLWRILDSAEDVEAFLASGFFVQATHEVRVPNDFVSPSPPATTRFGSCTIINFLGLMRQQDRRLSILVRHILRDVMKVDVTDRGVDLAVCGIWPAYKPVNRWQLEEHANPHSLMCVTAATEKKSSGVARINILEGSLLIGDRPVAGLPPEILEHPLYRDIFHDKPLLVIPSDIPGMDFATLSAVGGDIIHFSLRGENLVIRRQCEGTNDVFELLPAEKLKGDLPKLFTRGHLHWLNLSTLIVEVHSKHSWMESGDDRKTKPGDDWKIDCNHGQYHAFKGCENLVDIQSKTWGMISNLLKSLADPEDLIVTTSTADSLLTSLLSVALPFHGLSFFLNEDDEFESNDYKGMVYDEDQEIGALFGLCDCFVLRGKRVVEDGVIPRFVLVTNRQLATASLDGPGPVSCYVYKLDMELGCMTGDCSPWSKYLLAYLHAKTSIDWKPDVLTGKTGAEEALSILVSPGYQSPQRHLFTLPNHPIYTAGDVSPWYPQIIISLSLPSNRRSAKSTMRDAQQSRASGRAEYLFPQTNAAQTVKTEFDDHRYESPLPDLELEDSVLTTASIIRDLLVGMPGSAGTVTDTLLSWARIWANFDISEHMADSPSYNRFLWNPDLPQILSVKVYNIFCESNEGTGQSFQLLFLLPTFAYCSSHPSTAFLSMLLAFKDNRDRSLTNLTYADHKLLDGHFPTEKVLRRYFHVPSMGNTSDTFMYWQSQAAVDSEVVSLLSVWPTDSLPRLKLDSEIWDLPRLTSDLQALFSSCYRNWKLKENLTHLLGLRKHQPDSSSCSDSHLWDIFGRTSRIIPGHTSGATDCIQMNSVGNLYDHKPSSLPSLFPASGSYLPHPCDHVSWRVTLNQLLSKRQTPMLPSLNKLEISFDLDSDRCSSSNDTLAFNHLLSALRTQMNEDNPQFQEQYITDLHASARHVREEYGRSCSLRTVKTYPIDKLREHFVQCTENCNVALHTLKNCLGPGTNKLEQALTRSCQWPQITRGSLLRCLASTSLVKVSESWKACLVSFALLLLELQHSRRLLLSALKGLKEEFIQELENEGCDGWNPQQYPDWLLIQLQGNFLIRQKQIDVAMEMISPRYGENTVIQVNMGEGKSSVIIPIVAATLADGHQLARVVVSGPLLVQMFYNLVDRLGGLVNRSIHYLP